MDAITITTLASSAVAILVPYLKKGVESFVGEAGKNLWNFVKKPFFSDKDKTKLENFKNNPDDKDLQAWLKIELQNVLKQNPKFLEELKKLLPKAEKEIEINIQSIGGNSGVIMQGGKNNNYTITK